MILRTDEIAVTPKRASALGNIDVETITSAIRKGELKGFHPPSKHGGESTRWLILVEDYAKWLTQYHIRDAL